MMYNRNDIRRLTIPWYHGRIKDFKDKKEALLTSFDMDADRKYPEYFNDTEGRDVTTDYFTVGKFPHERDYYELVQECLSENFKEAGELFGVDQVISQVWWQRSNYGQAHYCHDHGPYGFSYCCYINFDPEVHRPTMFMLPFRDPLTGTACDFMPDVQEGDVVAWPSWMLHEQCGNSSGKERVIISINTHRGFVYTPWQTQERAHAEIN